MLFYDFENLNSFIHTNLKNNLKEEKSRIDDIIALYDDKKITLLNITTNMISITNILSKNKLDDFYKTISQLKNSFEALELIHSFSHILKDNLENISTLLSQAENIENNINEIKANLVEYNKQDEKLHNQIMNYEKNITFVLNATIELTLSVANSNGTQVAKNENKTFSLYKEEVLGDNHVLIVSEKEQKAYLPYTYSEVEQMYKNFSNDYTSIEDVIEKLYVVPLNKFKNSALSRFREGFHLIRNKEKGSITKALDLGLELMFKYDLNPIVVAACRNLDELDIYLDCLEENELFDFDCFEIRFEVSPQVSKIRKEEFYY